MRVLFVCRVNRKRSATAERIFSKDPALEVRSAGTSADALVQVNRAMLDWADIVFTMDPTQQSDLSRLFPKHAALARIICLGIEDDYEFLDPELITLLRDRTKPHLDAAAHSQSRKPT